MRRFFFGESKDKQEDSLTSNNESVLINEEPNPSTSETCEESIANNTASNTILNTAPNEEELEKALNEYSEEDWKKFAKNHPNVVKIITEISKEDNVNQLKMTDNNNEQESSLTNVDTENENRTQLSLFSPQKIIMKFIENSLAFLGSFYIKIQNKFSEENLKLVNEVLTEILESFAYTENRENSVAIAFVLRGLSEAQHLPTIREVPNIGIYVTVLTILLEVVRVLVKISFSNDKQELRNKIKKIFE